MAFLKNILSSVIHHKRIFSSFLLFFIVAGILMPITSSAFVLNQLALCGSGPNQVKVSTGKNMTPPPPPADGDTDSSTWFKALYSYLSTIMPSLAASKTGTDAFFAYKNSPCIAYTSSYTIAYIGDITTNVGEYASRAMSSLLNVVGEQMIIDRNNLWSITRPAGIAGPVFLNAWQVTKEWANLFVILGLLVVALAFILNINSYKQYIGPILLAGLLVNFSIVFVGLVIDASNIIIQQILGGTHETFTLVQKINDAWNATLWRFPISRTWDATLYLALSVIFSFMYALIAASLFMFSVIFIERYVVLAILFIFSPIALVFYVIPFSKARSLAQTWMQYFLKFAFMGVVGAFFLNLSSSIIATLGSNPNFAINESSKADQIVSALGGLAFYFIICIFFLLAGVTFTLKSAGSIATTVINAAKGAGLVGLGYVAGAGGWLSKKTGQGLLGTAKYTGKTAAGVTGGVIGGTAGGVWGGIKGAYNQRSVKGALQGGLQGTVSGAGKGGKIGFKPAEFAQQGITRTREKLPRFLGGVTTGTANLQRSNFYNINDKDKKALDAASHDNILRIARGSAFSDNAIQQKKYAIEKLYNSGKISSLDIAEQERLGRYALDRGADEKELLKKTPHLSHLKEKAVNEKKLKLLNTINSATGKTHTREEALAAARQQVKNSAYKALNIAAIRDMSIDAWTSELLEQNEDKKIAKAFEDLTDQNEKILKLGSDILKKRDAAYNAGDTIRGNELDLLHHRLQNLV